MSDVPELDLTDPEVLRDPFAAYGRLREIAPLARLVVPGMPEMWALTRHEDMRWMLTDPRFELSTATFAFKPDIPEELLPYMGSLLEIEGAEHARLRRLVSPAFSAKRAREYRPRIEPIVDGLLDGLEARARESTTGAVDLVEHFARPLPMDVICELVGIPVEDRPRWREYGAAVSAGNGQGLAQAVPGIVEGSKAAIAVRRKEPGDDLVSDLIKAQDEDGDRLSDAEMVMLIWNVVLGGQSPSNLIANGVAALFEHPDQLAALRADPGLMPRAVEELLRWCGPQLLTFPRFATEDVEIESIAGEEGAAGTVIGKGTAITGVIAAANRDPRAFDDPERLDITRPSGPPGHLGFAHGPHFCLGGSLARVEVEVALAALLARFPDLALAVPPDQVQRVPDAGTARVAALPVSLEAATVG